MTPLSRVEDVVLSRGAAGSNSMRNVLSGCVAELTPRGVLTRVSVEIGKVGHVQAQCRRAFHAGEVGLLIGDAVAVGSRGPPERQQAGKVLSLTLDVSHQWVRTLGHGASLPET